MSLSKGQSDRSYIIIGGGGHARVVYDLLTAKGQRVDGYVDLNPTSFYSMGVQYLGDDDWLAELDPSHYFLANGIGQLPGQQLRAKVFTQFTQLGFEFPNLVHPSAMVSSSVNLSGGVQVMAGAVIQCHSSIGANAIINTGALVDHDCEIATGCHVAPGACLCGHVSLARNVFVGSRACIIQEIDVAADTIIGAGAVLNQSVDQASVIKAAPAKIVKR